MLQGEGEAKGAERPKGETKRPEGAERKTLAHKLEDSKVIELSELMLPQDFNVHSVLIHLCPNQD